MFSVKFVLLSLAIVVAVVAVSADTWNPHQTWCPKYSGHVFSKAAGHAGDLKHIISDFRHFLGGADNGNSPGLAHGHRSINWDADVVPFKMPGDFFKNTVTRGAEFLAVEGDFAVSNPAKHDPSGVVDDEFSSFHPVFPKLFQTFSPKRLFTPVKSNRVTAVFSVPASKYGDRAAVSGFGAVFTNVAVHGKTFLNFYDENDCLIFRQPVANYPRGLSFGGIIVTHKDGKRVSAAIASVGIVLGEGIISKPTAGKNFVVLDDLIYGEPQKLHY